MFHLYNVGCILLVVYDIVTAGNDLVNIARLKEIFQQRFHNKDLSIFLSENILSICWMKVVYWETKPNDVPINLNKKLLKDEGVLFENPNRYRQLVES
jgi:hypothetical protein